MDEQWINNLRKRFAGREASVPEGLRRRIEPHLDETGKTAVKGSRHSIRAKTLRLWAKRAALIAACIIVVFGITHILSFHIDPDTEPLSVKGKSVVGSSSGKSQDLPDRLTDALSDVADEVEYRRARTVKTALYETEKLSERSTHESVASEDLYTQEARAKNEEKESSDTIGLKIADNGLHGSDRVKGGYLTDTNSRTPAGGKKNSSTVSFSLYGSNFSSMMGTSGYTVRPSGLSDAQSTPVLGNNLLMMSVLSDDGSNIGKASSPKAKHRKPVNAGISFRVPLSRILSVESGLFYSYHSSDFLFSDGSDSYTTKQRLHYIGLPLSVGIGIWKNRHFEFYAKGGGAVEFCVSGRSETTDVIGDPLVDTESAELRDKRPQWSVNASAGAQYNFNGIIGVYLEPGVSYYFDNGSSVKTIYKENKTDFTLNLGLRFTVK